HGDIAVVHQPPGHLLAGRGDRHRRHHQPEIKRPGTCRPAALPGSRALPASRPLADAERLLYQAAARLIGRAWLSRPSSASATAAMTPVITFSWNRRSRSTCVTVASTIQYLTMVWRTPRARTGRGAVCAVMDALLRFQAAVSMPGFRCRVLTHGE